MQEPQIWVPVELFGRSTAGRSRPPKVVIANDRGETREAYLKSPNFGDGKSPFSLIREYIATTLGHQLGLPCAEVAAVRVTPSLIEMARHLEPALGTQIREGPDLLLASASLGPGWHEWTPALKVSRNQLTTACDTIFFDTMIQNWDRCASNPNLLVRGESYGLIDHDEAFSEATGSDGEKEFNPPPWIDGAIAHPNDSHLGHPLWVGLRRHKDGSFLPSVAQWQRMSQSRFASFSNDPIFSSWSRRPADRIADYLMEAVERIDDVHLQLERYRNQ